MSYDKMPSATALEYDIRVKVSLFVAVKSFIVKVERYGMPDVEASNVNSTYD